MFEKILQKLKTQRGTTSNVSDRSLEDLARSLESIITTDEILAVADLSKAITSIDGNINHYTAEQIKGLEKKSETKPPEQIAKELEDQRLAKEAKEKENKEKGISPEMAQLMENQKNMMEMMAKMQGEKITNTRSDVLNSILKDAPDFYKNQIITGFNQMTFKDDEAFQAFTESTKTNFEAFQQSAKEQGLNITTPKADVQKPEVDEVNPVMKAALAAHAEANKKE